MKTLLITILLLICLCSVGQMSHIEYSEQFKEYLTSRDTVEYDTLALSYYTTWENIHPAYYNQFEYLYTENIDYSKEECLTLSDFVKLFKEYKQACYNDSTLLKHQHFMPEGENMCLMDWSCLYEHHYHDIWTHKDPNNFLEFMEYLETKIK